jgi:hypothetical protein
MDLNSSKGDFILIYPGKRPGKARKTTYEEPAVAMFDGIDDIWYSIS